MLTSEKTQRVLLSQQILPTSATMAGVCLTAVGLVKLTEGIRRTTSVDELLALNSGVFCMSMLFAFCAIYWHGRKGAHADAIVSLWLFIFGIFMMLGICVLFAFDMG